MRDLVWIGDPCGVRLALNGLASRVLGALREEYPEHLEDDLQDSVQEAVLQWLTKGPAHLEVPQVRNWLLTAARRNLWHAHKNDARWNPPREEALEWYPERQMFEGVLVREILDQCGRRLVGPRCTKTLRLWASGNQTEEVAQRVGISCDNARQTVHRGLEAIRNWFQAQGAPVGKVDRPQEWATDRPERKSGTATTRGSPEKPHDRTGDAGIPR